MKGKVAGPETRASRGFRTGRDRQSGRYKVAAALVQAPFSGVIITLKDQNMWGRTRSPKSFSRLREVSAVTERVIS